MTRKKKPPISKYAKRFLHIGLPIILLYLTALLSVLLLSDMPGYILSHTYTNALEHIVMSAVLILSGAVLLDYLSISEKK